MTQTLDFETVAHEGPQSFSATVQTTPKELDREEMIQTVSPIRVEGTVEQGTEKGEFVVSGSVAFEADLICSRCVEPYPFAAHSEFALRYVPRPPTDPLGAVVEVELADAELDNELYDELRVPLKPIVLEQVQLSLPMKPLCEEGCLGLCPGCGTNRNRGACECAAQESDPRWDALLGIREQLARKKDI